MQVKLGRYANVQVTVSGQGTKLRSTEPGITVRETNIPYHINNLVDIGDVVTSNVVAGTTVVYNEATDRYELKKLDFDDLTGDIDNINGGEF